MKQELKDYFEQMDETLSAQKETIKEIDTGEIVNIIEKYAPAIGDILIAAGKALNNPEARVALAQNLIDIADRSKEVIPEILDYMNLYQQKSIEGLYSIGDAAKKYPFYEHVGITTKFSLYRAYRKLIKLF